MKMLVFAKRCTKEILRDPLNLMFGLGFPVVILLLLSTIQANIPVDLFRIENLAPGISVFGLSFMALFSATLIAKDRESFFLQRLYSSPLKSSDFILGYMFSIIPAAIIQSCVCFLFSAVLGLSLTANILFAVLMTVPISVFYISLGLLCGSVFNSKQVGGICGALLTNLSAWLSGVWFDLELAGDAFVKAADLLPFVHAAEIEKAVINENFSEILPHIFPVLFYSAAVTAGAVFIFLRRMKNQ